MLATLDDLKAYLAVTGTDAARDALLTRILTAASVGIENACGRTFATAARSERRSGNGGSRLHLRDWPLTAVSSLTVDGREIPAATGQGNGYLFEADGTITLRGYRFALGVLNVEVAYTAGYSEIPADLVHAAIELSALAYKEKDWVGFLSKSLAGETVTFDRSTAASSARTNSAAAVLRDYKRVFPCD